MTVAQFFDLFLEELTGHEKLREYYKFHGDPSRFDFRKAYFCQRLQYVYDKVCEAKKQHSGELSVWDCGSGYSTTQLFLAMNGIASRGSTLEYYYHHIPKRMDYWRKYGDAGLVTVTYENIFEAAIQDASEDVIIVQDTLHHLEPLQDSLTIFHRTLRPGGTLIAIEENGNNLIQNLKLYRQRGNNRIIEYYDEGLGRKVLMGNENIRSLRRWKAEFSHAGFTIDPDSVQYVRLFPPSFFKKDPLEKVVEREQELWQNYSLLREYFFFGVNFLARKEGPVG